jgi:hypothetical protein
MNLFALTRNSARRVLRVPLSRDVQDEVAATFAAQEAAFRGSTQEEITFDGKYKPEVGECLVISDYDDIDNVYNAIANPLGVPEIEPAPVEFEEIKALFYGRIEGGRKIILFQNFDRRKIISNRAGIVLTFMHAENVYRKVDEVGLSLDVRLSAILEDKKLSFFSFSAARQIFDLTQYYKEATDEDLRNFSSIDVVQVRDVTAFITISDTWIRRKVALVMQSAILDKINLEQAKVEANAFGIELKTTENNGKHVLVLPENKAELKKVLRFLDEDYFKSALLSTPHLSNSKRQITVRS